MQRLNQVDLSGWSWARHLRIEGVAEDLRTYFFPPCDTLFACTGTPSTGTTLEAAHTMAAYPASEVSQIFAVQGPSATAPFTPFKSSAPNAWTPALNYTGGGLSSPYGIAIDASGNAWVANFGGGVSELAGASASSPGMALSASSGFIAAGLDAPDGIAIDPSGNIWVANFDGDSVSEFVGAAAPVRTPIAG